MLNDLRVSARPYDSPVLSPNGESALASMPGGAGAASDGSLGAGADGFLVCVKPQVPLGQVPLSQK